jgi:hypothetical protein
MHRSRFIFAAALALVAAGAHADNIDINLDFSKTADQAKVTLGGTAAFTNGRLELTNDLSQAGAAFLTTPVPATADYLATFQFEIQTGPSGTPADGTAFVVQSVGPDQIGGAGGSLGYDGGPFGTNSYAVEFNTYNGQGLGNGQDDTVALDLFGHRNKFAQTRWPEGTADAPGGFIDNGVYTAQIRVQPNNVTVTVSGGKNNLKPTVAMNSDTFLNLFATPAPPIFQTLVTKPIFFGFTGGTGGADSIQDILNLHIQSPAPAATAGP